MTKPIDFRTDPSKYRHWRVEYDGTVANLFMDVDERGGLIDGYELKLNSYDLGVDIELADIVQRMRFEHPEIGCVVMRSGKDNVFCAGANIRMLGKADHAHKVNFCKFTNETRNTYEAAAKDSNQHYICAVRGSCAGGGYELALACNHIILTDDASSAVSLPEVPLLAVLPGTGGLTRVSDKRHVRRDLADVFCSSEEGVRGKKAKDWALVDEVVPNSRFDQVVAQRAKEFAQKADTGDVAGIALPIIARSIDGNLIKYDTLTVEIDRNRRTATLEITAPKNAPPKTLAQLQKQGADNWLLACARQLDDAILHLRFNEIDIGILIFKATGDPATVAAHERFLFENNSNWLAREILLNWKRVLKRIDLTSRSMIALVTPGSCFTGILAELLFAADRSYMADGAFEGDNRPPAEITLTQANFGPLAMSNGLTRLETRFWGNDGVAAGMTDRQNHPLDAQAAHALGLVTFALDDIDWDDEIRVFLEERASFSPDALTGMEANLRFAGVETLETRVFGRLTAWQNWIFQRPNAVGEDGALQRYGSGMRAKYNKDRV